MSKSSPSLLALLGLVAVAGYQNRDKLSDMLSDARHGSPGAGSVPPQSGGGLLHDIGQLFGGDKAGNTLSDGLGDLVNRFKRKGFSEPAHSWVSEGPNQPINVKDLEAVLGDELLEDLAQKSGLPREELLQRLNSSLPEVVNNFTPGGRLPSESEARSFS